MNTPNTTPQVPRPWYKQGWPWFVISLPATAVVAGLFTVVIAVQNKQDLVQDSWYKDGVAINQRLDRQKRAKAMNLTLALEIDRNAKRLHARLSGKMEPPALMTLALLHPTLPAGDRTITLARMPDGHYEGVIDDMRDALYSAQLSAPDGDWQLDGHVRLEGAQVSTDLHSE